VDPCHCPTQFDERLEGSRPARESAGRPRRCRRCLLKGCERPFWPSHPQARYCSTACRQAARRWRSWRANQRYRSSAKGQRARRVQSRAYRRRRGERPAAAAAPALAPATPTTGADALAGECPLVASPAAAPATPTTGVEPAAAAAAAVVTVASADVAARREGERPAWACEDFALRPCARPGCYVVFAVAHECSSKHFCSVACRLALRRVLDREARYRARRRRWRRQRVTRRQRPRDTS